eukprot:8029438-Pyramimonas_sp.AAC.1
MRLGKCRRVGKRACLLLSAVSLRKLACRSSFGSERLAARGAGRGLQARPPAQRETARGPASAEEIRG